MRDQSVFIPHPAAGSAGVAGAARDRARPGPDRGHDRGPAEPRAPPGPVRPRRLPGAGAGEPPEEDDSVKLGIEESTESTMTWIGYDEYEEHLAALAETEQAAFTSSPTGGTPVGARRSRVEPGPGRGAIMPADDAPQPEPGEDDRPARRVRGLARRPGGRPGAAGGRSDGPGGAVQGPGRRPGQPGADVQRVGGAPAAAGDGAAPTPAPEQPPEPAEPAEGASRRRRASPAIRPTRSPTRPRRSRCRWTTSSSASRWRRTGLRIKPRKPEFTTLTMLTAAPGNPLVPSCSSAGTASRSGCGSSRSSGDARIDEAILNSLYRWRASRQESSRR